MICLSLGFLLLFWWWLLFITRLSERTVRDVYPFFHRVESDVLYGTFHPKPEEEFRATHDRKEFKQWQFRRVHLAIHQCLDIAYNCRLMMGWAACERRINWSSFPDNLRKGLRDFQISCMQSRTAAFTIRLRLRFWLIRMILLPFLPIPSFRSISSHSEFLIASYNTAEALAEALSLTYGDDDIHQNMLAALGTVDLELDGQKD
ncbi:MAG TPA: hypothetical protein VFP71_10560 [Candidatus Angelobacter sp.]|nr:hypothetical protein [Candidatus Angelobacter sp.]